MILLDADQTREALPFPALVDALSDMFAGGCEMPVRHHHDVEVPGEANATLLLMPAWKSGEHIGVKLATVFPGNSERGLPAISASYLLLSGKTGQVLAMVDGGELTARRTAAASALASRYLSRKDARHLAVVGTGRLSLNLVQAHAAVRNLTAVTVWGRNPDKAKEVASAAGSMGLAAKAESDLESAVRSADIVTCATLSREPLVRGAWLQAGAHLDLVGAFKPDMRESDDEAIRRSSVFVDTHAGAIAEGGDIAQPLRDGILKRDEIRAELAQLCRGTHPGRQSNEEITLFKSVGAALEDLAGAILAVRGRT